jgi:hypothetical protein
VGVRIALLLGLQLGARALDPISRGFLWRRFVNDLQNSRRRRVQAKHRATPLYDLGDESGTRNIAVKGARIENFLQFTQPRELEGEIVLWALSVIATTEVRRAAMARTVRPPTR